MPIPTILPVLVVVGDIRRLVNTFIPMDKKIKKHPGCCVGDPRNYLAAAGFRAFGRYQELAYVCNHYPASENFYKLTTKMICYENNHFK